jgi:steroid delta-isomerase-like uncharacterized protein
MARRLYVAMSLSLLAACGGEEAAAPPPASPAPATPPPEPVATTPPAETAPPPAPPKPSLAELEKKGLADWYAAFNAHDAKKLAASFAADGVSARPGPGGFHEGSGREAIEQAFAPLFAAFPDIKSLPVRVFQKADVIVVEWAATATNTGEFMGSPPTGKKAGIWGADVLWFNDDGLIKRNESFHDDATIAQQLGKMPGKPRELATLPAAEATWVTAAGTPDEDKLVDQMKNTWPATWNKRDAKAYAAVLNDDSAHIEIAGAVDYKGKPALLKELDMYAKALPDMNVTIDKAWGYAPSLVVAEFTFGGTMKGNIGPFKATNKPITIHGLDVDEIKDGKMQKGTTYSNGTELLAALGVMPKPGAAPAAKPKAEPKADAKPKK